MKGNSVEFGITILDIGWIQAVIMDYGKWTWNFMNMEDITSMILLTFTVFEGIKMNFLKFCKKVAKSLGFIVVPLKFL